ncbi:hypothetical protein RF55_12337 [Lasius niger]|uniref:Uncharacterized protein n=1 Tax=Lasius niger TaxID=67767 RepID=A0A0J7N691_LASNI|nr:hypothetical protein RF55_12337 [Lasius niger]
MWMRDKRKYSEDLIVDELKKLNKYLNGAITSARNAIAPKKRKIHPKDDLTLPSRFNHSEDKSEVGEEDNSRKKAKKNTETPIRERINSFTSVATIEEKRLVDDVSKEGLLLDKNMNNRKMYPLAITNKDSTDSNQEEFFEIELVTSMEEDEDLISDNDDFIVSATCEDE